MTVHDGKIPLIDLCAIVGMPISRYRLHKKRGELPSAYARDPLEALFGSTKRPERFSPAYALSLRCALHLSGRHAMLLRSASALVSTNLHAIDAVVSGSQAEDVWIAQVFMQRRNVLCPINICGSIDSVVARMTVEANNGDGYVPVRLVAVNVSECSRANERDAVGYRIVGNRFELK